MNKNMKIRCLSYGWLLSAVWLIGCTTDDGDGSADNAGPAPIVFDVSTEGTQPQTTRGMLQNSLDGEFGLLCTKYQGTAWGENDEDEYMMYNEMVMGSGSSWQTAEGYFVPESSYKLKFYAYYPFYDDVNGTSPIVMSAKTYRGVPYFDYTMPANALEQQDLMYAISNEMHADAQKKLEVVRLNFKHLLTAVTIAVGNCAESGTVRRVTLTNIYNKGRFRYSGTTLVSNNDEGKIDLYSDIDMKVTAGLGYTVADDKKSFLIIPQSELNPNASLKIQYEVSNKIYEFSTKLNALTSSLVGTPKNILLRLSVVSLQRMRVEAIVTDWISGANFDGAVSDQPVLELEALLTDWSDVSTDGDNTKTDIKTGPNPTVTGYGAESSSSEP